MNKTFLLDIFHNKGTKNPSGINITILPKKFIKK